ncbi:prepilin peptidase [Fodinisporobacter ferrooxydans]|uniref:Prepilin peptidase n=1 Tax=Fodinisporobacter ferrooxydans TaxID=2901836 RepID=A0ABY4CLW9_9BACL|nr:prepilin peptidase [Alicyclobacillaceae bacterium MYW30-H2]
MYINLLELDYIQKIYIIILSLFIGSFLNVVALRIPKGESIVSPPSRCTSCGHRLGWLDLIPVLSFVFLRGRCRYCGDRVSPFYAVFELLALIGAWILYDHFGMNWEFPVGFFYICVLLVITITDLKYMRIPDKIVFPSMGAMLLLRLLIHPLPYWQYILGFFAGGLLLLLIALVSRGGMGGGDVKLFAFIGLSIGLYQMLLGFFFACLLGSIFGLIFIRLGIYKRKSPIPFGPYIAMGCFVAYLWGTQLWEMYAAVF